MSKISKIAVSFLLILSIILNPFASALDIRARAINPIIIEGAKFVITELIKIIGGSVTVYLGSEAVNATAEAVEESNRQNQISLNALEKGVGVEFYPTVTDENGNYTGATLSAKAVDGATLTNEEKAFADYFINYVNSHPDEFKVALHNNDTGYSLNLTPDQYETIKNSVSDSYNEWVYENIAKNTNDSNVVTMVENGVLPIYNFNFVGPQPSLSAPVMTGQATLMKDGFVYSIPCRSDLFNSRSRFTSAEIAEYYLKGSESSIIFGNDSSGYYFRYAYTGYGGGLYILYNDTLYYCVESSYTDYARGGSSNSYLISPSGFNRFTDANGIALSSVYTSGDSYSQGFYYNKTGEVAFDRPQVTTIDDSEFTTTTGGGTVEIPRTEEEDIIGQALGLGLINPDSALEFNEDGTIAGADGLTLAKLQELIDMIAEGKLDFESIQEYLDLITKLVASGNYTATEQKVILDNIEALNQASAKSLEEINAAVLAISQALTLEGELEDVETEFSYLDVEHTGLVEAETIVNTALPIVGQAKQLVTNVFNSVDESSEVPNFNFYWDSNKDGEVEKYNFFDLSFMEQPLTNANLEDKSRFKDSMTIREFIQSMIVFFVYLACLIKLLRRVPGLLGSSESSTDSVYANNLASAKASKLSSSKSK